MPTELKVPSIGESVTEAYVGQWYKAEGEEFAADEPLVEMESDKATLDVPAPTSGRLVKILKHTGDVVEIGEVIAHIETNGSAKPSPAAANKPADAAAPAPAKHQPEQEAEPAPPRQEAAPPQPRAEAPAARPPAKSAPAESPPPPAAEKPAAPAKSTPAAAKEPLAPARSSGDADRGERRVPMTTLRRRIAQRLVEAQQHAALLTTFNEIDLSAVKQLRADYKDAFERKHKVGLGFMSFFVKATVDALRACPELNAMIEGDEIVYRDYYDIGVAVSTDKGLVVPVLRHAERMSYADVERTINDVAARAREGALTVDELQGGTFTITNGGVFGSLLSTPIVNPPQSGVLGMHAIQNRPVAAGDQVVIRPMMYVALTYDHRIVDGREAVTFLKRIKDSLEAPARMLLEV
jgi:2-oxoglutarate dehydrogenase E2 component (dihydrolipoamide succinyltransferase)